MGLKEIKILHCADFHLGAEFSSLGEKAEQRKRENFLAFENVISLCKDENVDFLLIAGDLFDHLHIEPQVITEVMEQFGRIPGTVAVITPGNHDPFSVDSCYYTRSWPKNVILFQNELSCVRFDDKNTCLWGAGFHSTYHPDSFFETGCADIDENRINLCTIHGDLVAPGQSSLYNPLSKDRIRESRFDYIALGHVHKRTAILKEGRTSYAYPGCPEGHGFDELGEQGVYLGTLSKSHLSLQFRKVCTRRYEELPVFIDNAKTNQEIAAIILQTMEEHFPGNSKENLYKIILKGAVSTELSIDPEGLSQRIASDCFHSRIENQTTFALDYDMLAKEQTLKGIFVRKMLEEIGQARMTNSKMAVSIATDALQYGLKAFEGEGTLNED